MCPILADAQQTRDKMPLKVRRSGDAAQFNFDPAMIAQIQRAAGLKPVILGITPMSMTLPQFLGLSEVPSR